jgi:DNA-binding NarL/FixJ family response regulator
MNNPAEKKKIIIADNQFLVTEALKHIMGETFSIKDIAGSSSELKILLQSEVPDILITDYTQLDFNGFEDLRELRKTYPSIVVVILSNNISRNELAEFNMLGIKNILHKNAGKEELFTCIDYALRGKKYYSDIFLEMLFEMGEKKGLIDEASHLTNSEIEIVRLIAQGLTTKEIAGKKFLSYHTIMTHRKNILRKLGVSNASELIMLAVRTGIIDTIEYHI